MNRPEFPTELRFVANRNHARRDEILRTAESHYSGGVKPFTGLDASRLRALLAEGFIDPAARQNESPTVEQFYRFLLRWPQARAHGYAISRRREDYRVSIDALECRLALVPVADHDRLRFEFDRFCLSADERDDNDVFLRAWWD